MTKLKRCIPREKDCGVARDRGEDRMNQHEVGYCAWEGGLESLLNHKGPTRILWILSSGPYLGKDRMPLVERLLPLTATWYLLLSFVLSLLV